MAILDCFVPATRFLPIILLTLSASLMIALTPLTRLLILLCVWVAFCMFSSRRIFQTISMVFSLSIFIGNSRWVFWLAAGLSCWFEALFYLCDFYSCPFFTLLAENLILTGCVCGLKLRALGFFVFFEQTLKISGLWIILIIWAQFLHVVLWQIWRRRWIILLYFLASWLLMSDASDVKIMLVVIATHILGGMNNTLLFLLQLINVLLLCHIWLWRILPILWNLLLGWIQACLNLCFLLSDNLRFQFQDISWFGGRRNHWITMACALDVDALSVLVAVIYAQT